MPAEHYFSRSTIQPPGRLAEYDPPLSFDRSVACIGEALEQRAITRGQAGITMGLLEHGGIVQFPGGLGIDYDRVFKNTFDTPAAMPAIRELAQQVSDLGVNVLVAPEHSAIIPAAMLGGLLEVPVIKVKKNGPTVRPGFVSAQVDSYTGGERDTLTLDTRGILSAIPHLGGARAIAVDEIIDTGAMTQAVHSLVGQLREAGVSIELAGAVALMEKTYTGAGEGIRQTLGVPVFSGLGIDDIGLNPVPWIKISGINQALTFQSSYDPHR